MRNLFFLFILAITFSACSVNDTDDDSPRFEEAFLPIDEVSVPIGFSLNEELSIVTIRYTVPTDCFASPSLYISSQTGNSRVVAVLAQELVDSDCEATDREEALELPISGRRNVDLTLRFWKGQDANGEDIFEEIVFPAN